MATAKQVKEAEVKRISQIGEFKKRLGGVLTLPSGLTVRVFNPGGMAVFLDVDTMPNNLLAIVQKAIKEGKAPDLDQLTNKQEGIDPEMFKSMQEMMDNVALKVLVEPKLHPKPGIEDERRDDMLYVDELPMDDKMFLLNWVTSGVSDLETFRQQQKQGVDALAEG